MSKNREKIHDFEKKMGDVWDMDDSDGILIEAYQPKLAHKAAQETIREHRKQIAEESRSSILPKHGISPNAKPAPGLGIRLETCHLTSSPTPHVHLEKFRQLINAPNVDLDELRTLSWKGIPAEVRHTVWKLLGGYLNRSYERRTKALDEKRQQYASLITQYFETALHQRQQTEMHQQIQKDLLRMSALHNRSEFQKIFERILLIWSIRHPACGYVQGINDLVLPYFVVFLSEYVQVDLTTSHQLLLSGDASEEHLANVEADCYWCMHHLMNGIQDRYIFAQEGIQNAVIRLSKLVERVDADLHQRFVANKVEYLQFAFRWINNILIRELPLRCVIRLWDTYLAEDDGFSEFHVYVCAGLLLRFSEDLKQCVDFQSLLTFLQNLPTYHWTHDEMSEVLAEAYRLRYLFSKALNHLES